MRLTTGIGALGLLAVPTVHAWGSLGHITVAYIATKFVKEDTATYFQDLLRNDTEHYMAGVATWADSIRYTKWGRFTKNFHFIDAKDTPPSYCGVDFERDCKEDGCVVSSIQNYTLQLFDSSLYPWRRAQAAKFVIHFVGDIHQPLHAENVAQGGNGIHVKWGNSELNLHHVWDTSIAEKMLGGVRRRQYQAAFEWAANLSSEIQTGKYMAQSKSWTDGMNLDDPIATSMAWANESNAFICSHVLPEGPREIVGQQLAGEYFEKAAPVIELQVARAGYRLAAWLDLIVDRITQSAQAVGSEEL
ncbi:S1/P1 nuclease [Pseudomassariella vexata]|uniref:S1/P1 nuclease n=1 Tax=Pseudomassariella vexata TaxID=1141098 RepID=A0A1Y2E6W3_9PEZI|nr:S1/P1 nuclease [Pseudomassariella vexata]ORY67313.1 S1/P1 nuclease [Pseudomassariella vexata]